MESIIMQVEDVFNITGRGTVVTCIKDTSDSVRKGDSVVITRSDGNKVQSKVKDIALVNYIGGFRNDRISIMLSGINKEDISEGDIIEIENE